MSERIGTMRPGIPLNSAVTTGTSVPAAVPAVSLMPRGPVFEWASFAGPHEAGVPSIESLPHRVLTTSGRAAIYLALRRLQLLAGEGAKRRGRGIDAGHHRVTSWQGLTANGTCG